MLNRASSAKRLKSSSPKTTSINANPSRYAEGCQYRLYRYPENSYTNLCTISQPGPQPTFSVSWYIAKIRLQFRLVWKLAFGPGWSDCRIDSNCHVQLGIICAKTGSTQFLRR